MDIRVGEYVRTKYGEIGIITKTYPRLMWRKRKNPSLVEYSSIIKHSKNIIDLIEEGDYVNGQEIVKKEKHWLETPYKAIREDHIKTTVTKELKEKLQQYKKIEEIVNTITDDYIRNAIKNAEKDYIPK